MRKVSSRWWGGCWPLLLLGPLAPLADPLTLDNFDCSSFAFPLTMLSSMYHHLSVALFSTPNPLESFQALQCRNFGSCSRNLLLVQRRHKKNFTFIVAVLLYFLIVPKIQLWLEGNIMTSTLDSVMMPQYYWHSWPQNTSLSSSEQEALVHFLNGTKSQLGIGENTTSSVIGGG